MTSVRSAAKSILKYCLNLAGGDFQVSREHPKAVFTTKQATAIASATPRTIASLDEYLVDVASPFFVARWGTTEFQAIKHLCGLLPWYERRFNRNLRAELRVGSGMFSSDTVADVVRFAEIYLDAWSSADIHVQTGVMPDEESAVVRLLAPHSTLAPTDILSPWQMADPWTRHLEGRRVLVVSAFAKDIESQYEVRRHLYRDPRVLPDFELQAIEAIQTVGGTASRFGTWFEALEFMRGQVSTLSFDVALVGCGAYGLPLCAYIRRDMGRSSIYMGGNIQLLFGLRGRRWDDYEPMAAYINEYWRYPKFNVGLNSLQPRHDGYSL